MNGKTNNQFSSYTVCFTYPGGVSRVYHLIFLTQMGSWECDNISTLYRLIPLLFVSQRCVCNRSQKVSGHFMFLHVFCFMLVFRLLIRIADKKSKVLIFKPQLLFFIFVIFKVVNYNSVAFLLFYFLWLFHKKTIKDWYSWLFSKFATLLRISKRNVRCGHLWSGVDTLTLN